MYNYTLYHVDLRVRKYQESKNNKFVYKKLRSYLML